MSHQDEVDSGLSEKQYLTRVEAAQLLRIHPSYLDKLRREKRLEAFRIGRKVLFALNELNQFMLSNRE
jgi:excisionase family DNA binding protein